MLQMVLTRALVHWFRQSRHSTLSSSESPSDSQESHQPAQLPTPFPGILSSILQSQFSSRLSSTDHTASSASHSPLYELLTPLPGVTPVQLASLLSHLPFMPPSQHAVRDARRTALSSDEPVLGTDQPVRVEPGATDLQIFRDERRHARLNAVPRPLPTLASFRGSVFLCHFKKYNNMFFSSNNSNNTYTLCYVIYHNYSSS